MKKDPALPSGVFQKGRWFYRVHAVGDKRVWVKLIEVRHGLPGLFRRMADLAESDVASGQMPALVAAWMADVSVHRAVKTQANDKWVSKTITKVFAEYTAEQVTPPDCAEFLKPFRQMPRKHNEMRSGLRELMRYAEEKGYRAAGTNPVNSIKPVSVKARKKYITDSELRRIKVSAMYGDDGKRTRSGPMLCALIDLAYLTGQRISDLLKLRWSSVTQEGIHFKPAKTKDSTGAMVLIGWTPRLEELIARIKRMNKEKERIVTNVITTQEGQPYTYYGASSAWMRAVKRSGMENCHFHDLRAKAITDKEGTEGMQQARRMGAHSTEGQTADYVRHRKAQRTDATR